MFSCRVLAFPCTARKHTAMMKIFLALLMLSLSACATARNDFDPLQPVNRATYAVNDGLDKVLLKPLATGYTAVTSKGLRTAISNFYDNATYLNTVLNSFLQGKGKQGFNDLGRFLINSTVGMLGFADVASSIGLEKHNEDFGQTLAVWGAPQGAYIVYPFYGPNSVRKTPDFVTSTATDALFWSAFVLSPQVTIPLTVLKYVDLRARLEDAAAMRDDMALDPYIFTRNAWRQNRNYLIYDGHPPAMSSEEDDPFAEDDMFSSED